MELRTAQRVFLCHASEDKSAVRRLYSRLRSDGYDPWLDEEDLLPGQDWQGEIAKAVKRSAIVVVCLSPASIAKTGYVQKEIRHALDVADEQPQGQIFLIPVRLVECEVPDRLQRWQWVDLFEPAGYDRLLKALAARGIQSLHPATTNLRLSIHRAFFLPFGPECFFFNATNIGIDHDLEITHVWLETSPAVHVVHPDRPLPKRLKPMETWETWVRVDVLDESIEHNVFTLGRVRLSTGEVVSSIRNEFVPSRGYVPGGPVTQP